MSHVAKQELDRARLNECHVIYMPLHGFLLLIKSESIASQAEHLQLESLAVLNESSILNDDQEGVMNDDERKKREFESIRAQFEFVHRFEFSFKSNDHYYYKNDRMREMDAEFGDLAVEISDMESEILEQLQAEFIK